MSPTESMSPPDPKGLRDETLRRLRERVRISVDTARWLRSQSMRLVQQAEKLTRTIDRARSERTLQALHDARGDGGGRSRQAQSLGCGAHKRED